MKPTEYVCRARDLARLPPGYVPAVTAPPQWWHENSWMGRDVHPGSILSTRSLLSSSWMRPLSAFDATGGLSTCDSIDMQRKIGCRFRPDSNYVPACEGALLELTFFKIAGRKRQVDDLDVGGNYGTPRARSLRY